MAAHVQIALDHRYCSGGQKHKCALAARCFPCSLEATSGTLDKSKFNHPLCMDSAIAPVMDGAVIK